MFTFVAMSLQLEDILKKVSSLYNRYGIRSITMDDVAKELCISKKTLYQFVSDKEDLVEKVLMYEISSRKIRKNGKTSRNAIEDLKLEITSEIPELNENVFIATLDTANFIQLGK